MSMKRYAVFAKKTESYQPKDDYTIWWFLNDTNDAKEAALWAMTAENQTDKYDDVQIVKSVFIDVEVG